MPVIGSLAGVSAAQWAERMATFRRGLNETGYVEGQNVNSIAFRGSWMTSSAVVWP
jgi:hypothetical protein